MKKFGKPYKLHRQWHLGEILDKLAARGLLSWSGEFQQRTVDWTITETGQRPRTVGTKDAEAIAQRLANEQKVVWIPVGGNGGKEVWQEVALRIEAMEAGQEPTPWEAPLNQFGGFPVDGYLRTSNAKSP